MQKPKNIPSSPGVYLFKDEKGVTIYVGKAKNLKNRISSYFLKNLGPKTSQMVNTATNLDFIKVMSEFEALLLEANLIKKYKPKYNIALRDDKSPLYVGITKDFYPRIITFRKRELDQLELKNFYGPFLSGIIVRQLLRKIRKVFPYSTHLPSAKICIYRQIGQCKPCPSEIESETDLNLRKNLRQKYLRNIRNIKNIFEGKLDLIIKDLEKEMKLYAKSEMFEEAQEVSRQINDFKYLIANQNYDIEGYLENPNLAEDIYQKELEDLSGILNSQFSILKLTRIECFDIAHLAGSFPTASMVVFINGEADKSEYRQFKIYGEKTNSDADSMREVLSRRIKHFEDWGRPDLIIVDGGKPQVSIAIEIFEGENIPIIGLAKRFETIVIKDNDKFIEIRARGEALKLLQRIRDEAHRFARRLHHKLLKSKLKV